MLRASDLAALAARNPFAEAEAKTMHLFLLAELPGEAAGERLEAVRAQDEQVRLTERCLHLHAPAGIARSKLVQRLDSLLGVETMGHNWRTVRALLELAEKAR